MNNSIQGLSDRPSAVAVSPVAHSGVALCFGVTALFTAVAISFVLVFVYGIPLIYDCAILLDCGRLLLMGRIPYLEYVEINLPMVHYVHCLPVLLSPMVNGNIVLSFQAFVLFLSICSSVALFLLISRLSPTFSLSERLLLVGTWQSFSILLMLWTHFGQREHLFMLAYIPWLYCREARHNNIEVPWGLSASIGLVAGPLFLLKPHFCLFAAAVEGWMLLRSRLISTVWANEVLFVVGWAIVYAVHFLFIPASMQEAFFGRWLPFVTINYALRPEPAGLVLLAMLRLKVLFIMVILIATIAFLLAARNMSANARFQIEVLTVSLLGGYAIYMVQLKGCTYHLIPAMGSAILLIPTVLIEFLRLPITSDKFAFLGSTWSRICMFCAVCFALILVCVSMMLLSLRFHRVPNRSDAIVPAIRAYTKPNDYVLVISTSVESAYPALIQENRLPGSRFLKSFPIAMIYKGTRAEPGKPFPYRTAEERSKEETMFLDDLGSDLLKYQPKLVFINTEMPCQGCPLGLRVDEYLSKVGWIDQFMKNYALAGNVPGNMLYVRKD